MRPARGIKAINRLNFFIELNPPGSSISESSQVSKQNSGIWVSWDADTTFDNAALTALPGTCQVKRYFARIGGLVKPGGVRIEDRRSKMEDRLARNDLFFDPNFPSFILILPFPVPGSFFCVPCFWVWLCFWRAPFLRRCFFLGGQPGVYPPVV